MTIAVGLLVAPAHNAAAQVAVSIGVAPVCPYGYYETAPYGCAPDGYYGPECLSGGIFIGAGPWYRGPDHFYGHVDHNLDYRKGYHGPTRPRAERVQRNTAQSFTARQCTTYADMKLPANTSK